MKSKLRFDGCLDSITIFRKLVVALVKVEASPIKKYEEYALKSGSFTIFLTSAQRDLIQRKLWYKPAKHAGLNGAGKPMLWNDCVGYEDCNPAIRRSQRLYSEAIERELNS